MFFNTVYHNFKQELQVPDFYIYSSSEVFAPFIKINVQKPCTV